jgi:transposase
MQDHVSRLVGLEGFEVKRVVEEGDRLDLEVELVARVGCCPGCGRSSLEVKDRPRVRVRDLPIAGRVTELVWRKCRYRCRDCGRTFSESHPELPARQRVTRRLRRWLFERVRGGAAHARVARCERTTRYQVARAFRAGAEDELAASGAARPARRLSLDEAHHRRGRELATVVSDLDRRRVVELLDGRSRRRAERYLRSLPERHRRVIEVVSIDPYEAYRHAIRNELPWARIVVDRFHLVRGANTALDAVRRERQREHGRRRPRGVRRSGPGGTWRRALYRARHRRLKANERLTERDRRRLCALFEREPMIAEACALKEASRSIYRAQNVQAAEQRLDNFLAAVERAQLSAFAAFADGVRHWRTELLAYFDEPTTNGYAEGERGLEGNDADRGDGARPTQSMIATSCAPGVSPRCSTTAWRRPRRSGRSCAFTLGPTCVRLDWVLCAALGRAWRAGGPGDARPVVDLDSFVGEVHGYRKQERLLRLYESPRLPYCLPSPESSPRVQWLFEPQLTTSNQASQRGGWRYGGPPCSHVVLCVRARWHGANAPVIK